MVPVSECGTLVPVSECGTVVPVSECDTVVPVSECGTLVPVSECGTVVSVSECGILVPVSECDIVVPVSEDMKSPLADTALPTHLIRIIQHNTGGAAEETEGGEECAKMASDLLLSLLVGGK